MKVNIVVLTLFFRIDIVVTSTDRVVVSVVMPNAFAETTYKHNLEISLTLDNLKCDMYA